MATIVFPIGNVTVRGIVSVQWLAALLLAYGSQTTVWRLYLTLLVLQIHGCELINIISHICAFKLLNYGLSTFPAYLMPAPATSVSLLFLRVHADIT